MSFNVKKKIDYFNTIIRLYEQELDRLEILYRENVNSDDIVREFYSNRMQEIIHRISRCEIQVEKLNDAR